MPFTCEISLEPGQLEHGPLTFDAWIDEPWGHYMPAGTPFARTHDDRGACLLELCGPGVLTSKSLLRPGDRFAAGTVVARYQTDGDDVVYDGPACRLVYI